MSTSAPSPVNSALVIRKIGPSITIFSVPFARGGVIPFGGRSTALTLSDNTTFLLPSHPLDPETLRVLQALPPIAHIAAFDREHTMSFEQYVKAFPDAKVYAGKGWRTGGAGDEIIVDEGSVDVVSEATGGEVRSCAFGKSHVNEDIGYLHVASRTLVQADLLMNLPPTEQYSKSSARSSVPFVTASMQPRSAMYKRLLKHVVCKDKTLFSQQAKMVSSWDFDRIIPCHGDVIETEGKAVWDGAFEFFLNNQG